MSESMFCWDRYKDEESPVIRDAIEIDRLNQARWIKAKVERNSSFSIHAQINYFGNNKYGKEVVWIAIDVTCEINFEFVPFTSFIFKEEKRINSKSKRMICFWINVIEKWWFIWISPETLTFSFLSMDVGSGVFDLIMSLFIHGRYVNSSMQEW